MERLVSLAAAIITMAIVVFSTPIVSAQAGWAYPPAPAQQGWEPDWNDESRWDPPESFGRWCPQGSLVAPDEWDPYSNRCIVPRGHGNWGY